MEQNKNNGTTSAAKWKEVLIGGVSGIAWELLELYLQVRYL